MPNLSPTDGWTSCDIEAGQGSFPYTYDDDLATGACFLTPHVA